MATRGVHKHARRAAVGGRVAVAPLQQRDQDGARIDALAGRHVLVRVVLAVDAPPLQQAVLDERRRRSERMFGATPTWLRMSPNRRRPSSTSRMTSSVQRSPRISSAAAIEQCWRGNGR